MTASILPDEIISLIHSVDPAYRKDPSFGIMFHDQILAVVRKLKDSVGRYLFEEGQNGAPDKAKGAPITINQNMPSTLASGNKTMLCGAFSKFKIRYVNQIPHHATGGAIRGLRSGRVRGLHAGRTRACWMRARTRSPTTSTRNSTRGESNERERPRWISPPGPLALGGVRKQYRPTAPVRIPPGRDSPPRGRHNKGAGRGQISRSTVAFPGKWRYSQREETPVVCRPA